MTWNWKETDEICSLCKAKLWLWKLTEKMAFVICLNSCEHWRHKAGSKVMKKNDWGN